MSSAFILKLVGPKGVVFDGGATYVKFSSPTGEMMILPGHESYICAISPCELEYEVDSKKVEKLSVKRGFCKFEDDLCEIALSEVG